VYYDKPAVSLILRVRSYFSNSDRRYRPGDGETICPPPMPVRLAADLRPSADGSTLHSPHISGGRRLLIRRQPACLWPRQLRHGTDRRTDRAIPNVPLWGGGHALVLFIFVFIYIFIALVTPPSVC